nr:MAG TPA: hypothetical protein [Caudoviricetes sp.]
MRRAAFATFLQFWAPAIQAIPLFFVINDKSLAALRLQGFFVSGARYRTRKRFFIFAFFSQSPCCLIFINFLHFVFHVI